MKVQVTRIIDNGELTIGAPRYSIDMYYEIIIDGARYTGDVNMQRDDINIYDIAKILHEGTTKDIRDKEILSMGINAALQILEDKSDKNTLLEAAAKSSRSV